MTTARIGEDGKQVLNFIVHGVIYQYTQPVMLESLSTRLYKDTPEMRPSPLINQDTTHGPSYTEQCTKLPLK